MSISRRHHLYFDRKNYRKTEKIYCPEHKLQTHATNLFRPRQSVVSGRIVSDGMDALV